MSNIATKETTKEEFNKAYKNYPEIQLKELHNSRVNPIFWDIPEGASILDLGCNSGEFMEKLIANKKGVKVKGLDLSENCVALAKAKGLDVVQGDGESLPFPDASFDYVVLMEVLVHVHDVNKLLREIKRVLKEDGVLIGSSPLKDLEMNIWDDRRLHHAYYTSDQIHKILSEFFFDVHFKILTGAQFSYAMAGTYIGDKDVEVLFKCGSKNMKPWDYKLDDKSILRVWMAPTQNAAVATIRMTSFADKMNKVDKTDILYDRFTMDDENHPGKWQDAWKANECNKPSNMIVAHQMENMLKIADMAVFQLVSSWSSIALLHSYKAIYPYKKLITEMDDWMFDVPSYNIASNPYRPNSEYERIAYEQIEISDAIICSTQFILDEIKKIFPNKKVFIVKNCIDFDIWDNVKGAPEIPKKEGIIRIGYTGSGNHGQDLAKIEKPILTILEEFNNVEFVCAGGMRDGTIIRHDRSFSLDSFVTLDKWPAFAKGWGMDIGVAPLLDSNFNRAKSNLRWLEYSALKIPTIASKVYPFSNTIEDGKDGLICNSQKSWYDSLRSLVLDSSRRTRIGQAAYKRVKKHFDAGEVSKTYRNILEVLKNDAA